MSLIAQHSTIEKIIPKIYNQPEIIKIHTNLGHFLFVFNENREAFNCQVHVHISYQVLPKPLQFLLLHQQQ